jgi:hypothetical protein
MIRTKFIQFSKKSLEDSILNSNFISTINKDNILEVCRIYIKIGNNLLKNPEIQINKKLISYINSNETVLFNQKVSNYPKTKNKFIIMDTSKFSRKTELDLESYLKLNKIFGKKNELNINKIFFYN